MTKVEISEILRGCEAGAIQSVGYMQVIPLTSDLHFEKYVTPKAKNVSTDSYGTMIFRNEDSSKEVLVPAHTACLTKQAAQDHSMTHAGLVKAKSSKTYNTAICVQQSQGGYIRGSEKDNRLIILPHSLRETAYKSRNENSYGRMWPNITQLMCDGGVNERRGNLIKFFNKYDEQLEQFVAEFEPVPDQVGAIILIGGEVVGVERTPNPEYWLDVWPMLIRECYGSLAILEAKKNGKTPPVPKTRVALRKANSLRDLRRALDDAKNKERQKVSNLVNNICSRELETVSKGRSRDNRLETVGASGNDSFIGQIIRESQKVVYASLVATETYRDNSDWFESSPFSM